MLLAMTAGADARMLGQRANGRDLLADTTSGEEHGPARLLKQMGGVGRSGSTGGRRGRAGPLGPLGRPRTRIFVGVGTGDLGGTVGLGGVFGRSRRGRGEP